MTLTFFSSRFAFSRWNICATLAIVICASGCGSSESTLETYPAGGTVTLPDGRTVGDGLVEFKSRDQPGLMTNGRIKDGQFSLVTRVDGVEFSGAVAGTYDVTIIVSHDDPQQVQGVPVAVPLPQPLHIDPGQENQFEIDLAAR